MIVDIDNNKYRPENQKESRLVAKMKLLFVLGALVLLDLTIAGNRSII